MSDESELARLRADLKAMGRVEGLVYFGEDFKVRFNEKLKAIRDKIAKLEAAADPWRDAREAIPLHIESGGHKVKEVARYARHLEDEGVGQQMKIAGLQDENARLTERVAELEAENATREELEDDYYNASEAAKQAYGHGRKLLTDMQPPFEWPVVGIDPVLDHARVLATAAEWFRANANLKHPEIIVVFGNLRAMSADAKPYPLKKGGSDAK